MKKKITTIDDYIAEFPKSTQIILEEIREIIRSCAPDAKETIKYGIPTFVLNENLVHFAGYKNHVGFYPTPGAIVAFEEELSEYKTGKGTLQFPLSKPIPLDLIRRLTNFRMECVKQEFN